MAAHRRTFGERASAYKASTSATSLAMATRRLP